MDHTASDEVSKDLPSVKLLLNLRGTWRRYLILPVPVVFLLMAFTLQLSDFLEETEIMGSELHEISEKNCTYVA